MPSQLFGSNGEPAYKKLPGIVNVKPLGTLVYVETLTPQEVLGSSLKLSGNTEVTVNQAYVLGIGPRVPVEHGLEVGQRVFISGPIHFGPDYGDYKFDNDGRKRGVVDYSTIKGEIVE